MSILFLITIFAFCALLWASFSVARHLRRSRHLNESDKIANRSSHIVRGSR